MLTMHFDGYLLTLVEAAVQPVAGQELLLLLPVNEDRRYSQVDAYLNGKFWY